MSTSEQLSELFKLGTLLVNSGYRAIVPATEGELSICHEGHRYPWVIFELSEEEPCFLLVRDQDSYMQDKYMLLNSAEEVASYLLQPIVEED